MKCVKHETYLDHRCWQRMWKFDNMIGAPGIDAIHVMDLEQIKNILMKQ